MTDPIFKRYLDDVRPANVADVERVTTARQSDSCHPCVRHGERPRGFMNEWRRSMESTYPGLTR